MWRWLRERFGARRHELTLFERLVAEPLPAQGWGFDITQSPIAQEAMAASPRDARAFVLEAAAWLNRKQLSGYDREAHAVYVVMLALLRRRLPLTQEDLLALLDWSLAQPNNDWRGAAQMVKALEDYLETRPCPPALQERVERLADVLESGFGTPLERRWSTRLRELCRIETTPMPLEPGEDWAGAVLADMQAGDRAQQTAWAAIVSACVDATGPRPSARWRQSTLPHLDTIGFDAFREAVLAWFQSVVEAQANPLDDPTNADILRGLAWLCAEQEDPDVAQALAALALSAYERVPGEGARSSRVGHACVWALGAMPGPEGARQLAHLLGRVRGNTARRAIDKALTPVAGRDGLSPEEIEELGAPTCGLSEVGALHMELGQFTAEISVTAGGAAELTWTRPGGRPRTTVPRAVRQEYAGGLKELRQILREVRKALPAQAERLEGLWPARRQWRLATWRERYLDHPLVGTLARRLIWRFGEGAATGIWESRRIVGHDGHPLAGLDDATPVTLWHPAQGPAEAVAAWRAWLEERGIGQPFAQAQRAVYQLTESERAAGSECGRFAGRAVRRPALGALCAERGWQCTLEPGEGGMALATRALPAWGLRAELGLGAGECLALGQVRFYALASDQPMPLADVAPVVFSEILRDVASVVDEVVRH